MNAKVFSCFGDENRVKFHVHLIFIFSQKNISVTDEM